MHDDYMKLVEALYCYGGNLEQLDVQQSDVFSTGAMQVKIKVQFHNLECIKEMTEALLYAIEKKNEERISKEDPVLKQAYEEYQILLKLKK